MSMRLSWALTPVAAQAEVIHERVSMLLGLHDPKAVGALRKHNTSAFALTSEHACLVRLTSHTGRESEEVTLTIPMTGHPEPLVRQQTASLMLIPLALRVLLECPLPGAITLSGGANFRVIANIDQARKSIARDIAWSPVQRCLLEGRYQALPNPTHGIKTHTVWF